MFLKLGTLAPISEARHKRVDARPFVRTSEAA